MALEPGTLLLQRYRIERILGQGGFGAVYLASDEILEQPCAVKENHSPSPEGGRQFLKEARLLANLRHPNLPRVTHHFEVGKSQFLVMDFVEGEDLSERLGRVGPLPPEDVLRWCGQIGKALVYLHGLDPPVFHRDIKPANIKITPQGEAILVDFGIAKESAPEQTTSTGAKGVTPGFAPPEQYGLGHTDARTDVYALGATLYVLLTGSTPPDSVELLLGTVELPSPDTIVPDLPPHLVRAVQLAMRPNRDDRPPDVATLLRLLDDRRLTWPPKTGAVGPALLAAQRESSSRRRQGRRWAVAGILVFLASCGALAYGAGPQAAPWALSALREAGIAVPGVAYAPMPIIITATSVVRVVTGAVAPSPTAALAPTITTIPTPTPIPVAAGLQNASGWRRLGSWSSETSPIVFSLAPDGETAALVRGQGVDLVDPVTGEVEKSLQGFLVNRTPYAIAHRGDTLLVGVEGEILHWDLATNNLIETLPIPGKELRLSASGRLLAVRDKYITVLNLETGQRLTSLGEPDSDQQFALSPGDRYFALTEGAAVALWNLKEGALERRLVGHGEPTQGLAFTADGSRLVSASGDVWDVANGERVRVFDSATDQVAVSPNAELIVGRDGSVWDLASGERVGYIPFGDRGGGSLQFTPDGRFLLWVVGPTAHIWTVDPEAPARATAHPAEAEIAGEAITDLNLYRLAPGEPLASERYSGIAVSADGSTAAAWQGRTLQVYRLTDESLLASWSVSGTITDASFLGDDFIVVLVGGERTERWELASGRVMQTYAIGGDRVEASPAGGRFAVRSKYIQVVEALTGEVVRSLGSADAGQDYAFSPDGRYLLIAAGSGVGVWDIDSGRLSRQLAGHGPQAAGLSVTPDGRRVAAASGDVWDLESGRLVASFDAKAEEIAVSRNGALVIDSKGTIWNADTGALIGSLDSRLADLAFVLDDRRLVGLGSGSALLTYRVTPIEARTVPEPPAASEIHPALTLANAPGLNLLGWWGQDELLSIRYGRDAVPPGAKGFGTESYRIVIPSPDGVTVTALQSQGIDLLDPARGTVVASYRMFLNPSRIEDIAYAGTELVVVKGSAGIERWDLAGRGLLQRYEIEGQAAGVSPDGKQIVIQNGDRLSVRALASGETILQGLTVSPGRQKFAITPDSRYLAVAHGGLVDVWDLVERQRVKILRSQESSAGGLSFSPDGSRLIAASGTVWDLAGGQRVVEFASSSEVGALSADGSFLIEGDGGVWATESGERRATLFDLRAPGDQVVLTGNGRVLLMRTADGRLCVWSARQLPPAEGVPQSEQAIGAANAARLQRVGHLGRGRLRSALWSPGDTFLAVNTTLNAIVYQAETLEALRNFEAAEVVAFDAGGNALVGGEQPLARIDPRTGEALEEFGLTGIRAAAYSPDGAWLAVAGHVAPESSGDGLAIIALADGLLRVLDFGRNPANVIERLEFTSDSRRLVASHLLAVSIWDVETGVQVRDPITGTRRQAALSPDGSLIAYLTPNLIRIEKLETGGTFRNLKADGSDFFQTGVELPRLEPVDIAFTGNTSLLVFYRKVNRNTGDAVASVAVWNLQDLQHVKAVERDGSLVDLSHPVGTYTADYERERPQVIPAFGLSPSGTRLFSLTSDGIVRVWTLAGARLAETDQERLDEMALSPDGATLVVPDALGGLAVVDLASGELVRRVAGSWDPRQLAFSSRSLLMVLQEDGTVSQVDIGEGRAVESWTVEGWSADDLLTVSPDGRLMAMFRRFAGDNRVLVFSLSPGRPLLDLGRFPLAAQPAFSPDGTTLAMVKRDAVELWDLQRGQMRNQIDGAGDASGVLRFAPNGESLINGRGEIWATDDGEKAGSVGGPLGIFVVSPNGEVLIKNDGSVWDARNGQSLGRLKGVLAPAVRMAFTPDGRRLLWMRAGGVVEIWEAVP